MRSGGELTLGELELVNHSLGVEVARLQAENVTAGVYAVVDRRAAVGEKLGTQHARQWHARREADEIVDQRSGGGELVVLQVPGRQQQRRENVALRTMPKPLAHGQQVNPLP